MNSIILMERVTYKLKLLLRSIFVYLINKFRLNQMSKDQTAQINNRGKSQPRVKIFYLKNIPTEPVKSRKNSLLLKGPTLSFLSSLIQNKNQSADYMDSNSEAGFLSIYKKQPILKNENINTQDFQPISNSNKRKNKQNTNAIESIKLTTKIFNLSKQNNKLDKSDFKQYSKYQNISKRMVHTSHQKYNSNYSNNQFNNLNEQNDFVEKDLLSNIVGSWDAYTDRPRKSLLRTIQKRKNTIKVKGRQQLLQIKKTGSLLKGHFKLFLEDQKKKRSSQIQLPDYSKNAIFYKEDNNIPDLKNQLKVQMLSIPSRHQQTQSLLRKIRINEQNNNFNKGFLSARQTKRNKQYCRLLQGPEVKLIPHLMENKFKLQNFSWTKIQQSSFRVNQLET